MKNTLASVVRLFIQVAMLVIVLLMLPEKSESIVNLNKINLTEENIINTNNEPQRNTFSTVKASFISPHTEVSEKISY